MCLPHPQHPYSPLSRGSCSCLPVTERERQTGGKVLVHCRGGISRSATVCLAYLMYSRALQLDDAFEYVRARRHVISPNANFMMQLVQFEAELRTLGFDRARMPLKPALSPCRLFSHSKSAFELTSEPEKSSRSPTDVTPFTCVPLVSSPVISPL